MPYTNDVDTTTPVGTTTPAKDIDNHIRQLKLDIKERLEQFITGINVFPLVFKDEFKGKVTGKTLIIPFLHVTARDQSDLYTFVTNNISMGAGYRPFYAPIVLPAGVTITRIRVAADKGSSTGWSWGLYRAIFGSNTAASVLHASTNVTQAGYSINDSATDSPFTHLVDDDDILFLYLTNTGSGTSYIHSAKVYYDTPDSRYTI